jgi:hypothetical protein
VSSRLGLSRRGRRRSVVADRGWVDVGLRAVGGRLHVGFVSVSGRFFGRDEARTGTGRAAGPDRKSLYVLRLQSMRAEGLVADDFGGEERAGKNGYERERAGTAFGRAGMPAVVRPVGRKTGGRARPAKPGRANVTECYWMWRAGTKTLAQTAAGRGAMTHNDTEWNMEGAFRLPRPPRVGGRRGAKVEDRHGSVSSLGFSIVDPRSSRSPRRNRVDAVQRRARDGWFREFGADVWTNMELAWMSVGRT